MAQQSFRQARGGVDPVLTAIARGYVNGDLVGQYLFPRVPVGLRAGRIIKFGKEHFRLYNTARAPGQNTKRVQFGYGADPYALVDHSLEGQVPIEILAEGQEYPGIDQSTLAVHRVQDIIALGLEKEQADLARNPTKYPDGNKVALAGTDQWSSPESKPVQDFSSARKAIRSKIGLYPNTAILGANVFEALKVHPQIIDRIKYTGRDVPTVELLQSLFEVPNILVGNAIYSSGTGGADSDAFLDVWGNDVVLAYTKVATMQDMGTPSYGYTYQLNDYPHVEPSYYGENEKTWYYPYTDARQPVIAGADAGFLISNAVAAPEA